jgi:hypothetical protein
MVMAQPEPPAGGAALDQVVISALLALVVLVPLMWLVARERAGRRTVLSAVADRVSLIDGLPPWVGLPAYVLVVSCLTAGVGVYFDVPIHMTLGRDEGPLANVSHYPIYFGLLGIFTSGALSAALARDPLPARTFRITRTWSAPMGAVVLLVCGAVGLAGFPLDDVWHRLFGQDVTEWGPTHVLMIGGAVLSVFGQQLLLAEAAQVGAHGALGRAGRVWAAVQGGFVLTLGTAFLMEFELGLPQFPMLSQVVLVGLISTWGLVYARMRFGRCGALLAVATFLALRAVLYVSVVPTDLIPAPFLPYLGEAVLVELVALVLPARGYRFGLASGTAIGTLGMLSEYGFSQLLMPLPWPTDMLGKFVLYGTATALLAGLVAVWQTERLAETAGFAGDDAVRDGRARRHVLGAVGVLGVVGLMVVVVPPSSPPAITGRLELRPAAQGLPVSNPVDPGADPRWAYVDLTVRPASGTADANWFVGHAWQGGDMYVTDMRPLGDGHYRTAQPLPVYGSWKTSVRLHTGDTTMASLPVYAPRDEAIPVEEIPAVDGTREFVPEVQVLQRERKEDVPTWLWTAGYIVVGLVWATAWALFTWLYAAAAAGVVRRRQPGTAAAAGCWSPRTPTRTPSPHPPASG